MSDKLKSPHTQVAHSILEKLARANMPANCFRITLWAIRNTYGYHRKETLPKTVRDIAKETSMAVGSAHLALQYLTGIELLVKKEDGGYLFNKHGIGVQPTEQRNLFSPLNKSVQPTEQFVQPTEHSECNYLKETFKETGKIRFAPPSLVEVQAYCKDKATSVNPKKFFSHYTAIGWKKGGTRIQDWRAAVDAWENSEYGPAKAPAGPASAVSHPQAYDTSRETKVTAIKNAWHDKHTADHKCFFCGAKLKGPMICLCPDYTAAYAEFKKGIPAMLAAVKVK